MKAEFGKDEITPALNRLMQNASDVNRYKILSKLGNDLQNKSKMNIEVQVQFDGSPMKSPSKKPRPDGKFALSYKWRYREGYRIVSKKEKGKQRGIQNANDRLTARRRVPVDESSKQLWDTGATLRSIGIISVSPNKAMVGPRTGHGQLILSVHDKEAPKNTRTVLGMTEAWKDQARQYAINELMKGV
jgi:hypothetical protein